LLPRLSLPKRRSCDLCEKLEERLNGTGDQVAQGLPDNGHDIELRVVEVTLYRQLNGYGAFTVLEQRHRQAYRQVDGLGAVDLFAELQLLQNDLVFSVELALLDAVVKVQVHSAFLDAIAGKLAGVGRQRGEFDLFEAGCDVQALQWVEGCQAAFDRY